MSPARVAVEEVLQTYFDGLYWSDVERLGLVFHPRALYVSASVDPLLVWTMPDYFPVVAERVSPASRNEVRQDSILSVEFIGERMAVACVECRIGSRFFTDVLTLIFTDERWQIISKVFEFVERAD